jgi:hypothetical protein
MSEKSIKELKSLWEEEKEEYRIVEIGSGVKQLYTYQTDWIKKYGLLTDGNIWRFYNNQYVEKSFKLKDILDSPEVFLSFWQEYTTPDHYYLSLKN